MSTIAAATLDETAEMRHLTDAEVADVNGGFIFIALGLALCFEVGMLGGAIAANYATTGNFWGDID
jgi:lactobin A/cerein 7B family class IIb bacteriocin